MAIESVLNQTIPPLEVIVVDNGGLPVTVDTVKPYGDKVRLIRLPTPGIGLARNAGVEASCGDFIGFLDDDDLWVDCKLEKQLQVLQSDSTLDAVFGHMQQFLTPEIDPERLVKFRHLDGKIQPAPLATSILMRRPAWDRVGPFDTSLQVGVDVDWYGRLCDAGIRTFMVEDVLYLRRIHQTNSAFTHEHEKNGRLLMLKRLIDRRRSTAMENQPPNSDDSNSTLGADR
jgi:glycosyltransferase involved in cell wall biosynthesis